VKCGLCNKSAQDNESGCHRLQNKGHSWTQSRCRYSRLKIAARRSQMVSKKRQHKTSVYAGECLQSCSWMGAQYMP
jgi:hypothetical protein